MDEAVEKILFDYNLLEVDKTNDNMIKGAIEDAITFGRLSVLKDFDAICDADAFMGLTDTEWRGVQKFFKFNKRISGWDK